MCPCLNNSLTSNSLSLNALTANQIYIPAFLPASLGKTEDKTMPVRQACDHPLVGLGGVNYRGGTVK